MKTKVIIEFICDGEVFKESQPVMAEFDDILLRPLRAAGYTLGLISSSLDKGSPYFVYEMAVSEHNSGSGGSKTTALF